MVLWLVYSKNYHYGVQYCPKSGCSTLRRLFLELHQDELSAYPAKGHHEIQKYFQLPPDVKWNTLPNFVLVRNPYTRVLSMFFNKYLNSSGNTIKTVFDRQKIKMEQHSFYNFLVILQNLKKRNILNKGDVHIHEQVYNLRKNELTQIVKLEQIDIELISAYKNMIKDNDTFIERVQTVFTVLNNKTEVHNKTEIVFTETLPGDLAYYDFPMGTNTSPPYWKFYTDSKVVDLVYKIYENDFKEFGYDKDSYPKCPS